MVTERMAHEIESQVRGCLRGHLAEAPPKGVLAACCIDTLSSFLECAAALSLSPRHKRRRS